MTDDTPAETPDRAALDEEGRRASERDDLIAAGADPDGLLVPLHPDDVTPYDGPDDEGAPFDGDPSEGEPFDPDHQPTAPAAEPDPEPDLGDPILVHDDLPALDEGDANPDLMAGDVTTADVDLDFLPTDDGEDQP